MAKDRIVLWSRVAVRYWGEQQFFIDPSEDKQVGPNLNIWGREHRATHGACPCVAPLCTLRRDKNVPKPQTRG